MITRFSEIPPFVSGGSYMVNVDLAYLAEHYARYVVNYGLDVNPDFQRGNVWTQQQKIRYCEYVLRGGRSGRAIYINDPGWNRITSCSRQMVLVDGKQRLDALLGFLNNEFPVFGGSYYRDFQDSPRLTQGTLEWHVNDLQTREEVLQWYIDLNVGGTVHSDDEIAKVRKLLDEKVPYVAPTQEEIHTAARMDRTVIRDVLAQHEAEKVEPEKAVAANPKTSKKAKKR